MATKLAKILPLIKGDWSSGTKYEMLDIVVYNGSSYIAKTESFTSTTNPSADTTNWQLLASKGSNGDDGVKGPKGDKGDQGAEGPAGANGKDGAPGANGKDGAAAGFGTPIVNTDNVNAVGTPSVSVSASGPNTAKIFTFTFANLKGEPGANGKDGAPGANGKDGAAGERGLQGPAGANGKDGAPGPQGERGPQGPEGPQGPAGANGKDGAPGPQGERGPAGPQVVNMSNMQVITFAADNSYGIRTAQDNYCKVGDNGQAFYYGYFRNVDINTGNLNFSSDRRVKKNIKNVQETCLDKINKIKVKTFDYIDEGQKEYEESKNHIGFIAQEVEEVFPELKETLVTTKDDSKNSGIKDRKFLKETKLIFVLWKAVQELSQEVEKLKRGE